MPIAKRFFTVSGLTVVSRLCGVLREAVLSHFLGTCIEMDAFLVAFRFPSFFRKCFAEGGFHSIFVPYFIDFSSKNKKKGAFLFSSKIFTLLFWVMLLSSIIVFFFADTFVSIMAPGFVNTPEKFELAVSFTKIIFPSVAFIALSTVYSSLLVSYNHFLPFSLTPILINLILICSLFMGTNLTTAGYRISYGVLISSIIQLVFLYIVAKKLKILPPQFAKIKFSRKVRDFLKKLTPVIIGAGVSQFNVLVDTIFGSFLETGSISFIYYADRFIQLPLAIFGISVATVLLPEISRIFSTGDKSKIYNLKDLIVTFSIRIGIPAAVGLFAISYQVIDIFYGHGKFTQSDVYNTSVVLQLFTIGLPAYILSKILSSILFAKKNSKTPLFAAVISIICNIILNYILIKYIGVFGIAVSTSISGFVNTYIIYKKSKDWFVLNKKTLLNLIKVVVSSCFMYLSVKFTVNISIIFAIGVGVFIYGLSMIAFRDEVFFQALKRVKFYNK
ncbi:MAG: murein biosynthesis integral membrane protein MurJ [Holosporales bacterium]|jgi:putative peptidoglycan lipid II flippase|nr:murein biosynthesis integral membrane protein MurJ [Holosporales bacterium]